MEAVAVAVVTVIVFHCVSCECNKIDNNQLMKLPVVDHGRWCDTSRRWL